MPYTSQVRENFRNKKVKKKRHLVHLSVDSSFLLSVERRVPFIAIVSANKRGEKGGLKGSQAAQHATPTRGCLNLLRLLELISPCNDLTGTSCVCLVPG